MKNVLIVLSVVAIAVVAYLVMKPRLAAAPPVAPGAGAGVGNPGTAVEKVEGLISAKTGVPVAAIGNAAQKAPTWLKVAALPVGVTAAVQSIAKNPKAAGKAVIAGAGVAEKAVASTVVTGAKAIGSTVSKLKFW